MLKNGCEAGCKVFTGGEIRHDKNCQYYPESFTKMYDDLECKFKLLNLDFVTQLRGQLKAFCEYIFKHYRVGNEALIDGFMDEFKSL
jgi:hypothetical protein